MNGAPEGVGLDPWTLFVSEWAWRVSFGIAAWLVVDNRLSINITVVHKYSTAW